MNARLEEDFRKCGSGCEPLILFKTKICDFACSGPDLRQHMTPYFSDQTFSLIPLISDNSSV